MVIRHNKNAQFVNNRRSNATSNLAKAAERLSSGYRINHAADDAAGLAIAKKLRAMDRGLRQGARNINDGINYTCAVDGSSQVINDMLHRLKELAVQASNDTLEQVDRDAIDLEYQQILDEIGHITDTANFNELPLFEKHLETYEKLGGNINHNRPIKIDRSNSTLCVGYTVNGVSKEVSVTIPHGTYSSPEEVADLFDTELYDRSRDLIIGVNTDKQFTMQAEGGTIDYISGPAASLFYDVNIGSAEGYLLGVTVFKDDTSELEIIEGKNDVMSFRVGNTDDTLHSVELEPGKYNRQQLIDHINEQIKAKGIPGEIEAVPELNDDGEKIIALKSRETVTGLSGNFIMRDMIHSPIYDICEHGTVNNTSAVFTSTKVLPSTVEIERGRNEYFVLNIDYYGKDKAPTSTQLRIDLLTDGENLKSYSPDELLSTIKKQFNDAGVPIKAELNAQGCLVFTSKQYGDDCDITLVTSNVPSGHMVYDLFDSGNLSKLTPSRVTSSYRAASLTAKRTLSGDIRIPDDENTLSFNINTDSGTKRIDLTINPGTYAATDLDEVLDQALKDNYPDLADKLDFSVGSTLSLSANGLLGADIQSISAISSASGYNRLIAGTKYTDNYKTTKGSESSLITYSPSNPSTGLPCVSTASGITTDGVRYYNDYTTTPQQNGDLLNTTAVTPSYTAGSETVEIIEGVVGGEIVHTYPAKMVLDNVLTQFSAAGRSVEDIELSFTLKDSSGNNNITVPVPKGSTVSEAINEIQEQLGNKAVVTNNNGTLVITSAETGNGVEFADASGNMLNSATQNPLANDPNSVIDGNKVYVPAKLTINNAQSQIPYTVDGSSDNLIIRAGNRTYNLRLTHDTYNTLDEIAEEINNQIASADGGTAKTTVTASSGKLVFTGDPAQTGTILIDEGSSCLIGKTKQVVNSSSDPYYDPDTGLVNNPATLTASGVDSHMPLTINDQNNTITMDYTSPSGGTEKLTITIPDGTYTNAASLTGAISQVIANDPALNGKITVSYASTGSNKGLTFSTVGGGDGYSLKNMGGTSNLNQYMSKASTSGGIVDTAANTVSFPATITNSSFGTLFTADPLEITDKNKVVSLNINGNKVKFTIAEGEYTGPAGRDSLLQQLRDGLQGSGAEVVFDSASQSLTIKTIDGGSSKSISLDSDNTAPYFKAASSYGAPSAVTRSDARCRILGRNSINTITIEDYFNEMEFTFSENGVNATVKVTVEPGTYTAATLAAAIQDSIDKTIPGALDVYVSSRCIGIMGATTSANRSISNFQGRLFERVFQNASYSPIKRHSEKRGTNDGSNITYIIGRNELQPENSDEIELDQNVIIYQGINDSVVFDLHYNNEDYKVEFTIPAGGYDPEKLAAAVQQAGREAIGELTDPEGEPLPAEGFFATIGLSRLGLSEVESAISSADKLVLCYKIPDDGRIERSSAVIDGVRGTSAYRIFYKASRTPGPSWIVGNSDLTDGVMINTGENDFFSFIFDGVPHDVTIPAGSYTSEELCEYLNGKYEEIPSLVRTLVIDGKLMLYSLENGDYEIEKITGSASDDLFYGSDVRLQDDQIGIHIGRRTGTYIWYEKTRVDEHLMRINTTGVSSVERAQKALERLSYANSYLTRCRALSGANENRSRHAYSKNANDREQLAHAESAIMDTDIAQEVSAMSKQQILLQVQQIIQQQSEETQGSILDVLS